jgi:pyridoxine 5-phosphate synthase
MQDGLKLGVNIDHVATLRQARGTAYPSVVEAALACERAGALGITVHLREDRRHIQDRDVVDLRGSIATRLNLEMANSPEIVAIALEIGPDEVCLVPEKREELTTEGGLDVRGALDSVKETVQTLSAAGIEVSLFVDPDPDQLAACSDTGAPYVELHTGAYCDASGHAAELELERLVKGSNQAHALGISVNAGHGINMENVQSILAMPWLDTLNIGHSIVARSITLGIEDAVKEMLNAMAPYSGGEV